MRTVLWLLLALGLGLPVSLATDALGWNVWVRLALCVGLGIGLGEIRHRIESNR